MATEETSQLKRGIIDATAGAISGAISRTVTSPLDVIKIRFQVSFSSEVFESIHVYLSFFVIYELGPLR